MRYGAPALRSSVLYVALSVVFKVFVPTASAELSTNISSFILETRVSRARKRLMFSYLYRFCAAVNGLGLFTVMRASLAKGGYAICEVIRCRIKPKRLLTEIRMLSFQMDVLRVPRSMRTYLWINELVCYMHTSAVERIYHSYPGVPRRNFVSERLSSCCSFRIASSSEDGTRLLLVVSLEGTRIML